MTHSLLLPKQQLMCVFVVFCLHSLQPTTTNKQTHLCRHKSGAKWLRQQQLRTLNSRSFIVFGYFGYTVQNSKSWSQILLLDLGECLEFFGIFEDNKYCDGGASNYLTDRLIDEDDCEEKRGWQNPGGLCDRGLYHFRVLDRLWILWIYLSNYCTSKIGGDSNC